MRHASLFSGIGGFDLAAQWMGWENVFQVEIDNFCQKVLEKNFPTIKRYGDIKQFDGTPYRGTIDILTGGFPCQPFSTAGQRKGKDDDRYLWPEMLRVIKEIRPCWIVGENVAGIASMALNEVLTSLEDQGYYTETYIIPACAVNAPHRRDRYWIIAHTGSNGFEWDKADKKGFKHTSGRSAFSKSNAHVCTEYAANTNGEGLQRSAFTGSIGKDSGEQPAQFIRSDWQEFPTQSPVRTGNDGLPSRLVRCAIHGAGNAIVPQVAFEIFKAIESTIF